MEKFYGNYLGICVCNTDPEQRGRVQIFIPHILPALDEGWNKEGENKFIECTGDNIELALEKVDIDNLKLMLPWAEAAAPIFGNSVSGHYNSQSGNFNQLYGTETEASANSDASTFRTTGDPAAPGVLSNNVKLTFYSPTQETNDSGTLAGLGNSNNKLQSGIIALSPNLQQQYGVKNGDVVSLTLNNGTKYTGYVGDTTSSSLSNRFDVYLPSGSDKELASNPDSGQIGTFRLEAAASKRLTGSQLDTLGPQLLQQVLGKTATAPVDLSKPEDGLYPPSSNPAQPSPFLSEEPPPYVSPEPSQEAILSTEAASSAPVSGTVSDRLGYDVWSGATAGLSVNHCGKRARLFDHALLKGTEGYKGYFTNGLTLNTGSASANDSTNYWVSSGYYSEATTVPSTLPFGTKLIFNKGLGSAGKIHGHVTTVADGRLLGSGAGENYNAYANLNNGEVTVLLPTQKYRDAFLAKYGSKLPEYALDDITKSGPLSIDDTPSSSAIDPDTPDLPAGMVRNPSDTQPTVTDTTGMPQGLFSVPNPGSMLWVFFRGGDPLYPVYFAASYGSKEWGNAYKVSSPGAHYPNSEDTTPRNQAIFRPNQSGGLTFTDTMTESEDARSIRMFHANGAHMEFNLKGSVLYSPNEHFQQVAGNAYNSCLNREHWTQGFSNDVTIGDRVKIVGNASQEALAIIEEHANIVKEINKNMLKGS